MNKRQKKKLYKKLHGYNPPKIADAQRNVQPKVPAPKQQLNHETLLKRQRPWDNVKPMEDSDFAKRISDALKRGAAKMFAAFSVVPDVINEARQQAERWATQERYKELLNIPEPPVVKTAKILTVQRLSGKRNKNHTRNRRRQHGRKLY